MDVNERKRRYIEVVPSARRLIESFRNLGYNFVRAVADIVDNSIQAGAREIDIDMKFDGENSWVRIVDDGKGMTAGELTEAMRFGTEREYSPGELGKFGLGLKTASISQCRRLTVASRAANGGEEIEVRRLDLDEIAVSNKWEITDIPSWQCSRELIGPLKEHHGTVVFWDFLDRMLKYKLSSGKAAANGFNKMARELEAHLGAVFHRFISGELGDGRKIIITLNGNKIEPWDPYARSEGSTLQLPKISLKMAGEEGEYVVVCTPYVLPTRDNFSSAEAFERSAGINGWTPQQGFYIYRENRLIQNGGWNGIRVPDEHSKLARIALDFTHDADQDIGLDIRKASVNLPQNLKEAILPTVTKVVGLAEKIYRSGDKVDLAAMPGWEGKPDKSATDQPAGTAGAPSQPNTEGLSAVIKRIDEQRAIIMRTARELGVGPAPGKEGTTGTLSDSLERAAQKVGETVALHRIRDALRADDPEAAKKIGW